MKTLISVSFGIATVVAITTVLQPSLARSDDWDASYERYARYSREVGDWWYYHPGYFAGYTYHHGVPRHRTRYLHSHAARWIAPYCRCTR